MTTPKTPNKQKPIMVGINHIALEVGDIESALKFYGDIFNIKLRSKSSEDAFLDLGDQFIALFQVKHKKPKDQIRHFGLVVDDRVHIEELAKAAGAEMIPSEHLEFYDPWGNFIQIVDYKDVQFTKTQKVLERMGVYINKTAKALEEIDSQK